MTSKSLRSYVGLLIIGTTWGFSNISGADLGQMLCQLVKVDTGWFNIAFIKGCISRGSTSGTWSIISNFSEFWVMYLIKSFVQANLTKTDVFSCSFTWVLGVFTCFRKTFAIFLIKHSVATLHYLTCTCR